MRTGYRIDAPRPRPPRRDMQDTTTPGRTFVHNGSTARLAIPCWYIEARKPIPAHPHDRMRHDMLGWPTPDHPDHVCQEWDFDRHACRRTPHMKCDPPRCEHFVDMGRVIPIHFKEEGYSSVKVSVLDDERNSVDGVKATGSIDADDDWIIRVTFDVMVPSLLIPSDGPVTYHYSVVVEDTDAGIRDLVTIGDLIVLPAPIGG